MAKVYLSSTLADLKAERQAATDWLLAAGHQPVHSYRPDSEAVGVSCLDDIAGCDLCVLILGHRYGHVPEQGNPARRSITHLEFQRAGELGLPRVALLRTSVPDARLSDLTDPQRAAQVLAFRAEVEGSVRAAEFGDLQGLIQGLSTGVQAALGRVDRPGSNAAAPTRAHQPVPTPTPLSTRSSAPSPTAFAFKPAAAVLALVLIGAFVAWRGGWLGHGAATVGTGSTRPAEVTDAPTPTAAPARGIELAGGRELAFNTPFAATYTVLKLATTAPRPGVVALRITVRAFNRDRYDMNFWNSGFRLLVDDVPREPVGDLNLLVGANSAREGELLFELPADAHTLALQVIHHAGDHVQGVLPLRWQPA
jgi:hypothetical protein